MASPVIEIQQAMNGMPDIGIGGGVPGPSEFGASISAEGVDVRVPRVVGMLVIAAAGMLVALRLTGFRFSFGANIGG